MLTVDRQLFERLSMFRDRFVNVVARYTQPRQTDRSSTSSTCSTRPSAYFRRCPTRGPFRLRSPRCASSRSCFLTSRGAFVPRSTSCSSKPPARCFYVGGGRPLHTSGHAEDPVELACDSACDAFPLADAFTELVNVLAAVERRGVRTRPAGVQAYKWRAGHVAR